jgi:bidirectional [NiFe] hydrogenase diaphorase subunit
MTLKHRINGVEVEAEAGASLLDTIRRHGFEVPSLCHHEAVTPYGACRLCLVEVTKGGRKKITTSCNYEVLSGIEVATDTPEIRRHRAMVLELLLAEAPDNAHLRALAEKYGVGSSRFERESDAAIHAERGGCILCGLCVRVCAEIVGVSALCFSGRGDKRGVGGPYMQDPQACIACGACAYVCPTGAVSVRDQDGVRRIDKWHVESELARCTQCGRSTSPRKHVERLEKKTSLPSYIFELCEDCKKQFYLEKTFSLGHM